MTFALRARRVSRAAVAVLVLALACPAAAEVRVQVVGEQVDLSATAAPLSEVLDRLSRQTGMKVVYDGAAPKQLVTLTVRGRSPAETVLAVFEGLGVNYALLSDASGTRVQTLMVSGTASGGGSTAGARGAAPPPRPEPREVPYEEPEPPPPDDPAFTGAPEPDTGAAVLPPDSSPPQQAPTGPPPGPALPAGPQGIPYMPSTFGQQNATPPAGQQPNQPTGGAFSP